MGLYVSVGDSAIEVKYVVKNYYRWYLEHYVVWSAWIHKKGLESCSDIETANCAPTFQKFGIKRDQNSWFLIQIQLFVWDFYLHSLAILGEVSNTPVM